MKIKEWKYLGEGRNRRVYLLPGGRHVIKIPLNDQGIFDNEYEARHCKKDGWILRSQKARCRLMGVYLVMEYVEPSWRDLPVWTWAVDCCQVGYTRDRRLVAYDYA